MYLKQFCFLILIFVCFSLTKKAQCQNIIGVLKKDTDIELWNGIEFSKELTKKLDFSFTYNLRFNENVRRFKTTFVQFGLSFPVKQIHKNFTLSPNFRISRTFDGEIIKRPFLDIGMRVFRSDLLQLNYKMRFQKDFEQFTTQEFDLDFYWRNRLTLTLRQLGNIKPYFAAALFTRAWYKGSRPDQFRFMTGINYKVKKRQSVRLGYVYRTRFNVSRPSVSHLIIFKMDFEIRDFIKKKKSKQ